MRLIDADEFKKYLKTGMNALGRLWEERVEKLLWAEKITGEVVKAIDAQPTAYDINKVLGRLEAEKCIAHDKCDGGASYKAYAKAIEIVKGGAKWK